MNILDNCAPADPSALSIWARENAVPLNITFELTPFCNFNCVMCYVHLTPEQAKQQGEMLTGDRWLEIARQARDMGTLRLTLTGGEPLTHPEFWKIYSELNQMGFLISLLTNGSLIDEAAMEKFAQYGAPHSVKLTLYGASNETYEKVCGVKDGFSRTEKAINLLKAAKIPLYVTSTIVHENACDLQEMYKFARKNNIPFQHTISVVKSSRGVTNRAEQSRFAFTDFTDELSLDLLEKSKFPPTEHPFAMCANYRRALYMTWNGRMQNCAFMSKPTVCYDGDLQSSWQELVEKLQKLQSPRECADCKWKIFCQRCPGLLCAESGDPEKSTPQLCNLAQRLFEIYQIKKQQEE